jgi:phosphatidylglycerophosphate synthase
MLDGVLRSHIDRATNPVGLALARAGVSANQVTLMGLILGAVAAGLIALGAPLVWALVFILASRLADGLDGAVARAGQGAGRKSDFGGYLDITCDFAFYGAIPLAFALRDPDLALPAAVLLGAFYLNGASFLAYAIFAAKRGMTPDAASRARGDKSLYFTAGLAEGFETIAVFVVFCLWPAGFAALSYGFAALCTVGAIARITLAQRSFAGLPETGR